MMKIGRYAYSFSALPASYAPTRASSPTQARGTGVFVTLAALLLGVGIGWGLAQGVRTLEERSSAATHPMTFQARELPREWRAERKDLTFEHMYRARREP